MVTIDEIRYMAMCQKQINRTYVRAFGRSNPAAHVTLPTADSLMWLSRTAALPIKRDGACLQVKCFGVEFRAPEREAV